MWMSVFAVVDTATDIAVIALTLLGLALGLRRSGVPGGRALSVFASVATLLIAWYAATLLLAQAGVYRALPGRAVAGLAPGLALPIVIGLFLALRSPTIRSAVAATPLSWMVGVQVYRVIGVFFLLMWREGDLPGVFAIPAALGDIATGVLAVPVALIARRETASARTLVLLWTLLGIADFVVAVATGVMSSPGPLHRLSLDNPNLAGSAYPFVMIPVFLVPLTSVFHGLCLWRLGRGERSPGVVDGQAALAA